jgi:hypothetical protein
MHSRTIHCIAVAVMLVGQANAEHEVAAPALGDKVWVRLEDPLAHEYAARIGVPQQQAQGLSIEIIATIEQRQPDGTYRIEHHMPISTGEKPQMETLTATVDPKDFAVDVTPKNIPVYSSPGDVKNGIKPTLTQAERRNLRLTLSKLDGVKLRTWALVDELGQ